MKLIILTLFLSLTLTTALMADTSTCPPDGVNNDGRESLGDGSLPGDDDEKPTSSPAVLDE